MVDLHHSRRGNFIKCYYWLRNKEDRSSIETYTYNNKASGIFYAKITNDISQNKNQINNVFMVDAKRTTLLTSDNVNGLETGSIVKFLGKTWIVDAVQMSIHIKELQFGKMEGETYITLRS